MDTPARSNPDSVVVAETFLRHLFAEMPPDSWLTLTAIHPDGNYPAPSHHIKDSNKLTPALTHLLANQAEGYGVFFGVATRRGNLGQYTRGGRADLMLLPAIFADVDRPPERLPNMETFPLPPTFVISTGRGTHLYWMLVNPTSNHAEAEAIMRGLAATLGGDKLTTAQSMRLPGSINTKYPHQPRCSILSSEPHRLYTLDDFVDFRTVPTRTVKPARQDTPRRSGETWVEMKSREITDILIREYQGFQKGNGWISSLCPCGHTHDAPGKHFGFNPSIGVGICFGRHGRMLVKDLMRVLRM